MIELPCVHGNKDCVECQRNRASDALWRVYLAANIIEKTKRAELVLAVKASDDAYQAWQTFNKSKE